MIDIARLPFKDRAELFLITARSMGIPAAIVEKDFWVCFVLDYLFRRSQFGAHLVFKCGTSLSKCYHLVNRFSEDIDLILDWREIGYALDEPWNERSISKILRQKQPLPQAQASPGFVRLSLPLASMVYRLCYQRLLASLPLG